MKKLLGLILTLLLTLTLLPAATIAEKEETRDPDPITTSENEIYLRGERGGELSYEHDIDGNLIFKIRLGGLTDNQFLSAFQFSVAWSTEQLEYINCERSTLYSSDWQGNISQLSLHTNVHTAGEGLFICAFASSYGALLSEEYGDILLMIKFKVKDSVPNGEQIPITLSDYMLRLVDENEESIDINTIHSTVYDGLISRGCYDYEYIVENGAATITDNIGERGDAIIPATLEGYPVKGIGERAFYGCTPMTTITIPDTVTSIGDEAFSGCSKLNQAIFKGAPPDEFGKDVFDYNQGVTLYYLPEYEALWSPNGETTWNGYNIDNVNAKDYKYIVSDGAVTITKYLGTDRDIKIPATIGEYPVTNIAADTFRYCPLLSSVIIPHSVTNIAVSTFNNCKELKSITVDQANTVYKDIDGMLFSKDETELVLCPQGKRPIKYVTPDSVISIGDYAFYNCTALTEIAIPGSVTSIGDGAFSACSSLTEVTIPDSVTSISVETFYNCSSLTSVTIGNGVISIGRSAFAGCTLLPSITIPNSVTSIGDRAFNWCTSLTEVTIPDSVT
ncbi:MAG: leucine-rich repeat protein, partial [Clostridia bacterium]|nr:leucine-rich repeat protein [Clostridia bacterium]